MISGAVGAVNGIIAASGLGIWAQAGLSAIVSGTGDYAMQRLGENRKKANVDWRRTIHNGILGGVLSLAGSALGSLTSYFQKSMGQELIQQADMMACYAFRQSSSEVFRQATQTLASGIRHINVARGISSVTGSILTWAPGLEYSM